MGNKTKKFISLLAATVLAGSTLAISACSPKPYGLGEPLTLPEATAEVNSNGGFAVEKGGYVYFINGQGLSSAENVYGEVKKGSLMRISTQNLTDGNYDEAEVVVPLLFVNGNTNSGIYIQGDYVYFATPTTDKDLDGNVMSYKLDFKRAKLDGTEVMSDYYFRTETNSVQYRFVKGDDGKVYCMYVEDGALKSFNTETRKTTVLVKGAASSFIFDKKDQNNDVVYYTMNVPDRFIGTDKASTEAYTQVYRVSATATVEVDAANASYTAKDGEKYTRTYDFNETYFKEKNDEAKEKDKDAELPYDLSDYTTYGYVNLGELVLDGIGSTERPLLVPTEKTMQFHAEADYEAAKATTDFTELLGYKYTIQSYENGGIYFTRSTELNDGGSAINSLYYLADATVDADGWNTILGNNDNNGLTVVSNNTTNASADALFYIEEGVHKYLYVSGDKLMRATQPSENAEDVAIARKGFTSRKLLYTVGDYLYSYTEDAKNLYRINYTGEETDYKAILDKAEYKDEQILSIEFNTAWYKPEIFNNVLLYNNAQTVNGNPYNYINAVSLGVKDGDTVRAMTTEELVARNEKYEEVMDYISNDVAGEKNLSAALMVYFRTGSTDTVDALWEEYGEDVLSEKDKQEFDAFVGHTLSERKPVSVTQKPNDYTEKFKDDDGKYYDVESYYFGMLGDNYSEDDEETLADDWKKSVYAAEETEDDAEEGLAWWAWLLIAVGGAAVVVGGVFLGIYLRKRSKKAMEERMRSSKPRKMIDTTDDKSIDVYADDEAETPAEEAEAAVEETAEEAVEETAESGEETAE